MTTAKPGPAQRLVELLETLSPEERKDITAWLLRQGVHGSTASVGVGWSAEPEQGRLRTLASLLPPGPASQLVTIRLPADRHAELRDWCAEHGFTMAAVVRGLIERFLEQRQRTDTAE
jgi:hypothetical protein